MRMPMNKFGCEPNTEAVSYRRNQLAAFDGAQVDAQQPGRISAEDTP